MEVFRDIDSLRNYLFMPRCRHQSVGLVPTMGALHEGHLSLLREALSENDLAICTIYVNPTQFNNKEDLVNYPRNEAADLEMLEKAGCHAVFVPDDSVMYEGDPVLNIRFDGMDTMLEGEFRPGHFNGVALVVSKLLNIVQPDSTYFGQKDLQQFLIIRRLVKDLGFMTRLRCVPVYRENSGLAMSSRNMRLSENERQVMAPVIYQTLKEAAAKLETGGEWTEIQRQAIKHLKNSGLKPEYFEAVNAENMKIFSNDFSVKRVALCVAAYVGKIRLIDNLIIERS